MKDMNANLFLAALVSASNNLYNNKNRIDAMNVFPIPDGDTGTNMSSTFKNSVDKITLNEYNTISDLFNALSKEMLMNARGNSGVITSQIFKGFSVAWNDKKTVSVLDVIEGFKSAQKVSYASVSNPVEGTILTVIRMTAEELANNANSIKTIEELFAKIVEFSRNALNTTPDLLPVLKEVGVVDSGGEGLVIIFEGFLSEINKKPILLKDDEDTEGNFFNNSEIYDGEFGYCTEFILELNDQQKFEKNEFTSNMEKLGNSLVVVQDNEIVKIHIHTEIPGDALNFGQQFGEFITLKIDNMTKQAENTKKSNEASNKSYKTAIISCNNGNGWKKIMREYECNFIITTDKSTNPSSSDFLDAISQINAENFIILPNNKNIYLSAKQAADMTTDKKIHVVPTKNQAEGLLALLNFSNDMNIEENVNEIESSLEDIVIGEISVASKDTVLNGIEIKQNNFLEIKDGKIIGSTEKLLDASINLINSMVEDNKHAELLSIYFGSTSSEKEAKEIKKQIEKKYSFEIEIHEGNQELYNLIFSLE